MKMLGDSRHNETNQKPWRIVLADDHAMMRDGLVSLINAQSDLHVVAQAANGREVLERVAETKPDGVVLDISMPELDGIQTARLLQRQYPALVMLVLTAFDNPVYLRQMIDAGARGYVIKNRAAQDLIVALRRVLSGKTSFDVGLIADAVPSLTSNVRLRGEVRSELTERETELLLLVARGHTNKDIAARLNISVKTVESHKSNIMTKLSFTNRADFVRYAIQQGWLRDA